MARGSSQANTAATTGNQFAQADAGNASSLFSTLAPTLQAEAAHPAGMAPTDIAAADTAGQQSTGGSQGAALGQGMLRAARTRNAGGADAAIGASSRAAGENLSEAALTTRLKNATLKQQQQQSGIHGLEGLFGENLTAGNQALGQVAGNVNASTNAENASWDWAKDLFTPILSAAGSGAAAFAPRRP